MGLHISILCCLLLLLAACSEAHVCMQDEVFDVEEVMASDQQYFGTYPLENNTKPIRLLVDTSYLDADELGMTCTYVGQELRAFNSSTSSTFPYTCTSSDVLTPGIKSYLISLVERAQQMWQNTLYVMPVQGLFKLIGSSTPQGVYGGVNINGEYVTGMEGVDMVMFVTARPIVQGGGTTSTLAVARVVQDDQLGRPVLGHLNINVGGIDMSTAKYPQNFGVVIHEMTHALGFNSAKIRKVNPAPGTNVVDLVKVVPLNVGAKDASVSRTIVTSPRVVAWARKYYGCNSTQGVELENQGGTGTALSHWEKRILNNEYMTGTASRNPVLSELTLSLLEDTGWYRVNYSTAGQLLWGQGMGCNFLLRSCMNWPEYPGYFCTSNKKGCTADYQAKGVCQIEKWDSINKDYQYFDDPTKGGAYDLPDFCPITWGYDNGWCFDTSLSSSSLVDKGEVFGENSRCFQSSLLKGLPVGGSSDSACYETYCTGPQELRVKIDKYWYLCPPGAQIRVIGYGGIINCPDRIEQVCANSASDPTWPVFLTISPNAGGPGLKVTIVGRNFLPGTVVRIDDPLDDIVVVSPTFITATIPRSDRFKNPSNIIDQKTSVVVTDTRGRSSVGYNSFTIKVSLNGDFIRNALDYLGDNWLITAAIIAAILISCTLCCFCIYRQKGQAKEADTEYYE